MNACLRSSLDANVVSVKLDAELVFTAHLFNININSVFEEIIK